MALRVPAAVELPIYQPKNELERLGVKAAVQSLSSIGESGTVQLILQAAPHLMNVEAKEIERIRALLKKRYQELSDDPLWAEVPSPLPSAFNAATPIMLVAPPRDATVDPAVAPVVVFLHGYGGNGKIFTWLVSRALPEAWVIAPSHGVSWRRPHLAYLDRAIERFEQHTHRQHGPYWLVGLSDGGVGSFEVLADRPKRFAGLANIVGLPRAKTAPRLPPGVPMLWMNGKADRFVGAATVSSRFAVVKQRVSDATLEWFDGGHYFLIEDDSAALQRLRSFVTDDPRH